MIRLIVKYSKQVTEDQWSVCYSTFLVDCPELETKMVQDNFHVVGAEVEDPPTSDNSEYMSALEAIIKEGVENEYAVHEIVLAVQRLNQRS